MQQRKTVQKKPPPGLVKGTYLQAWRVFRRKTQVEVGEAIGLSDAQVSRMETGKRDYMRWQLEKLAKLYDTDPASLLCRDPFDPEGIWTVWDSICPADRAVAIEQLRALTRRKSA